jgi:alkylation response protein AidB-like acyl-CoA dehydrogenase
MTTATIGAPDATDSPTDYRPAPLREGDDRFVPLAAELGARFAERADEHDRDNTFVHENFHELRAAGYHALAIPTELGGLGGSLRQVCYAQAELAKYCGATALAINMHLYGTLTTIYRWKHGAAAAEGVLRRIASDGLILMTSGGSDGIWPTGVAVKEDGGYRVTGRKRFCSQAPIADVLSTMAVYDDPQEGRIVLAMGIPTASEGFRIVETWDTLGMRATASHDVQLDEVFVSEAQVAARRPWGRLDPFLRNAILHGLSTMAAVYYGVAAGARDVAVRTVARRQRGDGEPLAQDPALHHLIGRMDSGLRTAWWSLLGGLSELGDDYAYELTDRNCNTVLLAKRHVVTEAVAVVDAAMEAVGGSAYFKRSPLERAYRDVRAGKFHPLPPEKTLLFAGRLALGLPVDQIW